MTRPAISPDDAAEHIAIQALAFLAAEPDRIGRFLAAAGIGPAVLRDAAREPQFLAAVLEHLLSDESLLLVFCEETRLRPRDVWNASHALGGRSAGLREP